MFYTIIKRIPGSQGTKVSVVYSHVSEQTGSIYLPLLRRLKQRLSTLFEGQQLLEPILFFLPLTLLHKVFVGTTLMLTVGCLPFWIKRCT
jgi:hypothetical protein